MSNQNNIQLNIFGKALKQNNINNNSSNINSNSSNNNNNNNNNYNNNNNSNNRKIYNKEINNNYNNLNNDINNIINKFKQLLNDKYYLINYIFNNYKNINFSKINNEENYSFMYLEYKSIDKNNFNIGNIYEEYSQKLYKNKNKLNKDTISLFNKLFNLNKGSVSLNTFNFLDRVLLKNNKLINNNLLIPIIIDNLDIKKRNFDKIIICYLYINVYGKNKCDIYLIPYLLNNEGVIKLIEYIQYLFNKSKTKQLFNNNINFKKIFNFNINLDTHSFLFYSFYHLFNNFPNYLPDTINIDNIKLNKLNNFINSLSNNKKLHFNSNNNNNNNKKQNHKQHKKQNHKQHKKQNHKHNHKHNPKQHKKQNHKQNHKQHKKQNPK